MPRIIKQLPDDPADYGFGDLVYWHLFVYGTRPNGDPAAQAGRVWNLVRFCQTIGIKERTLRNWIFEKHLPDNIDHLLDGLFGNESKWDEERVRLQNALKSSRELRKSRPAQVPAEGPMADQVLDPSDEPDDQLVVGTAGEVGKVRKTGSDGLEKPEESIGPSADEPGQTGESSSTEESGKVRKSAPESSEQPEPFPQDQPPAEQDDATQNHEDEPAGPSAQPGQEEER